MVVLKMIDYARLSFKKETLFICDLFVSHDDPLMSQKTFTRTEQLYVLSHDRGRGQGWDPRKTGLSPNSLILTVPRRYFCCGSLLLFVLAVCIYTLVQLLC